MKQQSGKLVCPAPVVCPACKGELAVIEESIDCQGCSSHFGFCGGFPDLIIGGRFDDPEDEALMLYEERSNEDLTRNYWIPMFRKLWPNHAEPLRLLSVGCGTGVDVELLHDAGYDSIGIDCGNRTAVWPRRQHQERLLLANGKHLPFPDGTFDAVFCGCVFPHVGVVGDSSTVAENFYAERLELAREMTRVLKPGGKIVVSSPNRRFLVDIFHGRKPGSYKPRFNWPQSHFLLSVADYRKLFQEAGCSSARALPVENYWGFIRSRHSLKGILFGLPVRFVFWLVSREPLRFLRASPINPWIVVLVEK